MERLGFDPIGSTILQWTRVTKTRPMVRARVEPSLVAFMRDAYSGAYDDAPMGETWAGWVRRFQHLGALVVNPLASLYAKKFTKDPALYPR